MRFTGSMIKETIKNLVAGISRGQIEIYNEFSLQHEIGILLRSAFPDDKVLFERNVYDIFQRDNLIKREIDITVFSRDNTIRRCAIELKFPRNGQHPEQMFSFCRDVRFAEQLKKAGFAEAFVVIFADDHLFHSGQGDGIYGYFRQNKMLCGSIRKPTGKKDETIKLLGSYDVQWSSISGHPKLKYTVIKANNGQQGNI